MLGLHLVAVVLLGGAVVLHVLSRRAGGSRTTTIRLSSSSSIHVVELDGRRLLVGTGPASAPALLAELAPTASFDESPSPRDPFLAHSGLPGVAGRRTASPGRDQDGEVRRD